MFYFEIVINFICNSDTIYKEENHLFRMTYSYSFFDDLLEHLTFKNDQVLLKLHCSLNLN